MCHPPPPWGDSVFCFTVWALGFKESTTPQSSHQHPLTIIIYILTRLHVLQHVILFHHTKGTLGKLENKTQDRRACAYLTEPPHRACLFPPPTCPISPSSCRFMHLKVGAGPSITSNISVSNLMRRCEWILKQAGEAPGEACAGLPGQRQV